MADLSKSSWWDIEFLDQNGQVQYTVSLPIQNGRNILQLQEGEVYAIRIIVREPISFVIRKIQFRERLQILYTIFKAIGTPFRTDRFTKDYRERRQ